MAFFQLLHFEIGMALLKLGTRLLALGNQAAGGGFVKRFVGNQALLGSPMRLGLRAHLIALGFAQLGLGGAAFLHNGLNAGFLRGTQIERLQIARQFAAFEFARLLGLLHIGGRIGGNGCTGDAQQGGCSNGGDFFHFGFLVWFGGNNGCHHSHFMC